MNALRHDDEDDYEKLRGAIRSAPYAFAEFDSVTSAPDKGIFTATIRRGMNKAVSRELCVQCNYMTN